MVCIYARQSIDKKDSISIEGQIELCRKECDGEIVEFIDKGYSGKNTDRPAFTKLMQAVEQGIVEKVVVYRLDRISRSITDFGRVWDTLKSHNVEFVSVNEKFDTSSPVGRAMIYIIMIFAQLERETIAERVKDNYHQRARTGAYLGGPAPFGFDIKRTAINGKIASMLITNQYIDIVKDIFNKYAYSNMSLGKIAEWLVKQNIPGIQRKTWDSVSISRILHNPSYVKANADIYFFYKQKNLILYNEIEEFTGQKAIWLFGKRNRSENKYTNLNDHLIAIAHHDGIIEADVFLKCQAKLDSNKQLKNTGSGTYSWLTGLVKCGYCGYSMRVINSGKYTYFNCTGKSNLKICTAKHLNPHIAPAEKIVADFIKDKLIELSKTKIDTKSIENAEINSKKIELLTIEKQISNLIDSLTEANSTTMKYINERLLKLDQRKSELINEIGSLFSSKNEFILPNKNFDEMDFIEKKDVAYSMINKIYFSNEEIKIDWKV